MEAFNFVGEMNRLRDCFGARFYTETRCNMIFEIIKTLPDYSVKKIIDYFIETQRQPPTPQDFRKAAYEHRKKHSTPEFANGPTLLELWGNCTNCNSIGYVWISTEFDNLVARCDCHWGKDASWFELPIWKSVMRDPWTLSQMQASSFNPMTPDLGAEPRQNHIVIKWRNVCQESIKSWEKII